MDPTRKRDLLLPFRIPFKFLSAALGSFVCAGKLLMLSRLLMRGGCIFFRLCGGTQRV